MCATSSCNLAPNVGWSCRCGCDHSRLKMFEVGKTGSKCARGASGYGGPFMAAIALFLRCSTRLAAERFGSWAADGTRHVHTLGLLTTKGCKVPKPCFQSSVVHVDGLGPVGYRVLGRSRGKLVKYCRAVLKNPWW